MKRTSPSVFRRISVQAVFVAAALSLSAQAFGDFLWMSAEFDAIPARIYRYNLGTGLIDLVVEPGIEPTADVYNNLAFDGTNLYLGLDDDQLFAKANPITGVPFDIGAYAPPVVASSLEDGAFNLATGTLWRTTYGTGVLLETDTDGNVLATRTIAGAVPFFDGLEWVGSTLYATRLDAAEFGEVTITDAFSGTFTPIPLVGIPGGHAYGGLAYDQDDGILYMLTTNLAEAFLWEVDPIGGTATLVKNLTAEAGYPSGSVLPDAMGWVPFQAVVPEPSTLGLFALGGLGVAAMRRRQRRTNR
jgi:hypothetical protein